MKIPKKLKIGAVYYDVVVAAMSEKLGGADWDGEVRYDRKNGHKIYINADMTREAQETTLIHEVLHCLNSTMSHEFLDSLAEQLYQVFSDNKLLK